ncbi:uncharacterized protein LOC115888210 [Sitophilus oryzae]|uniref:Uncharacterized protein LOC115879789 n=1 Tax=Sitophilus oryzae TaxID=7048 RepID=A0A6J2YKN0_SITOR|nr:uncharacterized protein LOC115879789 [Sitophilus oryzae]XP_030756775.1 uncharacterized protein LOC115882698 [Sitophilus oryzae]XP_030763704.1 uncharacterized protein LOC115888210 [Sitophilus oryzae]
MMTTSEKIEVFTEPILDNSIVSLQEHTYKPYGSPKFQNSDEIRIPVHFQDIILDISESYIYIEGTFETTDATKKCYLSNNSLAFLFDEIRYEMGGEKVAAVRKPGITTALKTMVSFGTAHTKPLLTCGWGLNEKKQDILDLSSNIFSGKLPLKYLMGFAEDYTKGIFNVKQELIIIIARTFSNCYIGEVEANIKINKIEWKIRHIIPEDRQKLKILSRINKGSNSANIHMTFRTWDLYELPALRETSSDVWAIRTSTSLEKPRYIIIGFQDNNNSENFKNNATQFTSANVSDIRVYLNSTVFPYERWNLDFTKKLYAAAYYNYENFQRSYYGREFNDPMMHFGEYTKNPVFLVDCVHQTENVKSSTVDVKIEFQTRDSKFPKDTKVYALIIHDSIINYNILNGSVSNQSVF